jgi:hypothetical protein
MAFTSSRDGGLAFEAPVRVHEDGWVINGCPDDGPAMAVDAGGTIHLVWPTVAGGTTGVLHYATSRDGRSFSTPIRVPTLGSPKPSHPQVAVDGQGGLVIAWDEVVNGVRTAAARRLSGGGFGPVLTLAADGPSMYPIVAATDRGWIAAWTTGGPSARIHVRPHLEP